jgi:pimeloyl-ACP methyl ester carboxylesterase
MTRLLCLIAASLAALLWTAPAAAQPSGPPPPDVAGDWTGIIEAGGTQLHIAVHIRREGTALSGTMDSLDQAALGMPLANVQASSAALAFDVPAVGGHYAGAWNAAQGRFAGEWTQASSHLPLALCRGQAAARPTVQGLDGDWDGTLEVAGLGKLRLVFHIRTTPAGTTGALESPDQGPGALPLSSLSRTGSTVALEAKAINVRFEGDLSADGTTIAGHWVQNGKDTPLTIKRRAPGAAGPAPLARPQTPRPPFPYRQMEVGYDNPTGRNHLAGTLTLPPGKGPFPAALLITGSGQQDRDETLMGHKPFLVLADYLSRRGIAVLRVDDRGIGGSTGEVLHATSADFATDVEAGLAFLRTRADIDPRRIGLIGHSEGGLIGPMVAARNPSVAWLVMMAGPGVSGERIIVSQQRLIAAAAGTPAAVIDTNEALQGRLLAVTMAAKDAQAAREAVKPILAAGGIAGAAGDAAADQLTSDWFRSFLRSDPVPALKQLRIPVLAVAGRLDLQVPPSENLPAIRAALAANRDAQVVELPGLNHLFQTARAGGVGEYAQIEETIAPAALKSVGDWIVAHTR